MRSRNVTRELITLSKEFSRQHYPLLFCYIWSESDLHGLKQWLGQTINHVVILREKEVDKISVWFDLKEVDKMHEAIRNQITTNNDWFINVCNSFQSSWKQLLPYITEEKEISNLSELREYYNLWLSWWPPMAILFEIPNVEKLPQDVHNKALEIRTETQDFSDDGESVIDTFFEKHHPNLAQIWRLMKPDELFTLSSLTDERIQGIKQRKSGFALIDNELLSLKAVPGKLALLDLKLEASSVDEYLKEIKGQTACRGYARGKVRIVLTSEDIDKLGEGEILVTEMTTPEFVPAMKRAAAIVTDEGGVTCHAAIVSRELNKPCVIGTKIATTALKNDMEVEVLADQGIVKILK